MNIFTIGMTESDAKAEASRLNSTYPRIVHEAAKDANGGWAVAIIVDDVDGRRVDRWVAW